MIHRRAISFKKQFAKLPHDIQEHAKKQFMTLVVDPHHPSLQFKQLKQNTNFSVRINDTYRALGTPIKGTNVIVWFFIGDHKAYEHILVKQYTPKGNKQ